MLRLEVHRRRDGSKLLELQESQDLNPYQLSLRGCLRYLTLCRLQTPLPNIRLHCWLLRRSLTDDRTFCTAAAASLTVMSEDCRVLLSSFVTLYKSTDTINEKKNQTAACVSADRWPLSHRQCWHFQRL